jgi:nucleoside-diphosphate-sugar epimerase
METVLVTGINGFVGTRVASVLMESGFRVRGSVRRRPTFCCRDEIDIVQVGNLEDCPDWSIALDGVSVVVHLAARVHIMKDTAIDPIEEYRKANVEGTVALAEQSAMHGVRRFVFVSSIKAMGEERDTAYMESDVPAPVDPYGISKLEAEEALRDIGGNTGMEVVILRPPLIYGPHVKGNFYQLMEFANKGIPIPLGSVKNRRSFIYVGNFADAIATGRI